MRENVANNVAQPKVQDLTEQWRKGELDCGVYYVQSDDGVVFPSVYSAEYDSIKDISIKDFWYEIVDIKEVLAPVPSYEKWQSLNQILDSMQDTNKVLAHRLNLCKDLLLECRYKIIADLDNARLCESSVDIEDFEYLLNRIDNAIGEQK